MKTFKKMTIFCVILFSIASAALAQQTVMQDEATTTPESEAERLRRELLAEFPNLDLGREADEVEAAKWLFEDKELTRERLGLNPRFVYNPKNLADPMVIPWVRQNIIAAELLADARKLIRQQEYSRAAQVLTLIVNSYAGTSSYKEAVEELADVKEKMYDDGGKPPVPIETRVVMPPWIYDNTKAVIWDPVNPVALVGDATLKAGDAVPRYPDVVVKEIQKSKVVFTFKDEDFDVTVEGL
jgi:hypothetical protein